MVVNKQQEKEGGHVRKEAVIRKDDVVNAEDAGRINERDLPYWLIVLITRMRWKLLDSIISCLPLITDHRALWSTTRSGDKEKPSSSMKRDIMTGKSRQAVVKSEYVLVRETLTGHNVVREVLNSTHVTALIGEKLHMKSNPIFEHHQDPRVFFNGCGR
ncbi:hypothetical protein PTKIN_Ptkin02bG0080900 [Pterospermum kingtungense]